MPNLSQALTNSLTSGLKSIDQTLPPDFSDWINDYSQSIAKLDQPKILLLEPDPLKFCAAAIAFLKNGKGSLFLGNPAWKVKELSQVAQLFKPDCLWANQFLKTQFLEIPGKTEVNPCLPKSIYFEPPFLYFATGGSSGKIRFAAHSLSTLEIAVTGLRQFLKPCLPPSGQINSLCVLPLFHVGGFMQWWRSALTGGQFCLVDYDRVKNNPPSIPENFVTSLVPTQLQYLLDHHPQFLKQFKVIFLGGAPPWPSLLNKARQLKINLAPTYGTTETAGQIATLTPAEFLRGKTGVGRLLPHINLMMIEQPDSLSKINISKSNEAKFMMVRSEALFLDYYPRLMEQMFWNSCDLGYFKQGYLHIVGRHNRQIISGGEKIDPLEIETWLLDQNLVEDVVVVGLDDRHWGEAVTAIYIPQESINVEQLIETVKTHFAPHKCPKHWLPVPEIGRSPLGKINYARLSYWANKQISDPH